MNIATHNYLTEDIRWQAVESRDPGAARLFYYAVKTTGVYCRPTCSSRLPRRENVVFFDSCEDAERAGFNACKRCKPSQAADDDPKAMAIIKACRLLEQTPTMLSLEALAGYVGMSPYHFHRTFKQWVGVTPKEYADAQRRNRLHTSLENLPVTHAIFDAGFNSNSQVYERKERLLGMTPAEFRKGAVRQCIRSATATTSLGWVIVAATPKGVCMIEFGATPAALQARLASRFPHARHEPADAEFTAWLQAVVAQIEAPRNNLALPLDIQGTAFQQRVWKALQSIPAGTTASYADMAQRIEQPRAVRAVAQACAANPVAVAIPCHRVIRSDGTLSGYRWGVERKQSLLGREAMLGATAQSADDDKTRSLISSPHPNPHCH